ncbi:MAG: cupin, partial [Rhodoferax sp.]|nr:cupin [Rhodoferax sp.]
LAMAQRADGSSFDALQRNDQNLDYWDGEP